MTPDNFEDNLDHWLDIATQKLPVPVASSVRDELAAHYQDAFNRHSAEGLVEKEACRLALSDLGDADLTAKSLESVHFSRNRCFLATLVCLGYPAALFTTPLLAKFLDVYQANLVLVIATTLVILYALHAYKALVHASIDSLERPIQTLSIGQSLWALICVMFYLFYGRLPLLGPSEELLWDFSTFGITLLNIGMLAAEIVSAIGALWIGIRLVQKKHLPIQLTGSIGWLLMAVGCLSLLGGLAVIFGLDFIGAISSSLGFLMVTVTLSVMSYFFLISATRSGSHSRRMI